ncbi:DcaP family trimeric outer membrane transporter [Dankookia sp. GCM10030260]|uniref:DcaP family trimeric outer membrane transporter n=1 Tax=Dankookia sp. GCM10030260 TaxID=3273390 RepID=UPI003622C0A3
MAGRMPLRRGRKMRYLALPLALGILFGAPAAFAQPAGGEAATIAELRRQLEAMQRRLDQLEARSARRPPAAVAAPAPPRATAQPELRAAQDAARQAQAQATAAAAEARAARQEAQQARASAGSAASIAAPVEGLDPPEPMGRAYITEDALRADLPGIALRIPNTDTQVRLYGFAKLTTWADFNGRNQTDAPSPASIPLTGSPADQQGGDYGMTARFSRFGVDTRTLTGWGTLETRLEGDFGGGSPTSSNAVFRLRQAWGELGTPAFRVLVGQANSLWNEGLFETIIDATNLNQSFIRQAQIRLTGRLAPGLTGQVSLEAPETTYVSAAGTFNPGSSLGNGASPAFNAMPDLHGRLTYRESGWELGLRSMLRDLRIETAGTAATGGGRSATGWGLAGHVRMPLSLLGSGFGADELIGMAYYGEGIGRYFFGNTGGQDATSNLGLASAGLGLRLDPLPSWGMTAAWRHFWEARWRSNFAYSYARQDYPAYAGEFTPGSATALGLNREVQQVFANLIWSPFAEERAGTVTNGWLDIGLEYLFTRRDLYGGATTAGAGGVGHGIANRVLFGAVARF